MRSDGLRWVLAFVLLAGGCAGDDAEEAEPVSEAAGPVSFTVKLVDAKATDGPPLEGIEVCAADRPDVACATSGADGRVTLALPARSELMMRCHGPKHGPAYMTWTIGTEAIDAGTFGLLDQDTASLLVALSGGKQWPGKGAITVNVYEELQQRTTRVAGATVRIEPEAGGGPTYVSAQRLPDSTLTATTEGGPALFFDLDPGEVTITIAHPTRTCVGGFGWATGRPDALRSKIFAGGLSNVTFVCPP